MKKQGVPILMYHALEDAQHPAGYTEPGDKVYVLQAEQFREQMEYLRDQEFKTYLINELLELKELPDKAVVLTFDDGHESNITVALPILQEFGFKAEFFITTGWIDTARFLTKLQIRELADAGMGIGSHGVTHNFLDEMSTLCVEDELRDSMDTLTCIVHKRINNISAPGGRTGGIVRSIAKQTGYKMICTSHCSLYTLRHSLYSIPRFALRRNIDMKSFSLFVAKNRTYLCLIIIKSTVLSYAKKVMGNKRYELVRQILFGVKGE